MTQCSVTEVRSISARLVEVRAATQTNNHRSPTPVAIGSHVAIAINGPTKSPFGAWRHYTVKGSGQTDGQSWISWIAFTNGDRPGATFHRDIQVGNPVSVRVSEPDNAIDFLVQRCDKKSSELLFVGDETAIGLFSSFSNISNTEASLVIVGEKSLVGSVRSRARSTGLRRDQIAARVYWATGKIGPE